MFRSKSSREIMRQMAKRTEKERLDKLKKKEKNRTRLLLGWATRSGDYLKIELQ